MRIVYSMLGPLLHKPITNIEDTKNKKLLSTLWRCFVVTKAATRPHKGWLLVFPQWFLGGRIGHKFKVL